MKTYEGSCHCGNVRYKVTTDLAQVIACNCSMCGRAATLLNFVKPDKFELLSGNDVVSDYQFNKKNIHHLFCSNCGIKSYAHGTGPDGSAMIAVNVRCFEGVDPSALKVISFDGKNHL
ncbi:MAG: Glutathione-dependent formaldehyde-activating protein [Labilithrix sp.]|nr:Glutathione-dependent formaldehyde-activating protein [Labilithrix sp.]